MRFSTGLDKTARTAAKHAYGAFWRAVFLEIAMCNRNRGDYGAKGHLIMIKLFAAGIMVLDHIGMILFPDVLWWRIVGRLSMPLFAYGIARGFYFSEKKNNTDHYIKRLFFFALVSQIPYTILSLWIKDRLEFNIGFTWLLSVVFMKTASRKTQGWIAIVSIVLISAYFLPIDYGVYGVLYPLMFYSYMLKNNKSQYAFLGITVLFALDVVLTLDLIQAFSLIAFPILLLAIRYDTKVRLPKGFYYWFYPLHLIVLMIIKTTI